MLNLNGVTIEQQSFGSVLAIFLSGSKEAICERFNSFWNWKGTTGNDCEMEWWTDTCAMFWTYPKNLRYSMEMAALAEILNSDKGGSLKGTNPMSRARAIASQRMAAIDNVRLIQNATEIAAYTSGEVSAEKPSGNFNDDVLAQTVSSGLNDSKPSIE